MDKKVIQSIWDAYQSVVLGEAKKAPKTDKSDDGEGMDPVDKKELKKDHDEREDGDIDNDGDEDEADEYLHNRRRKISKRVDESIKPYVSSAGGEHEVLNSKGKAVKTFKSIEQANLYLKKNYDKLMENSQGPTSWSVYKRIQERAMQPNDSGTPPESMDDKLTASDKKFLDAHGTDLSGIDSGIDGAKAAADTAAAIKASSPSAAPVRGDENRGRE